ncbi:MAG: DUF3999 family protein [Myxococcales bacterium]|nr:DUF3999 family protein [Myxococcales bacterium]
MGAAALLLAIAISQVTRAQPELSQWRYLRPIEGKAEGLARLELDLASLAHARPDFSDFRLLDQEGAEVPFGLHRAPPPGAPEDVPSRLNKAQAAGTELLLVIEAVQGAGKHNRVELELPEESFVRRAEVATSGDGKDFHTVPGDGLLFDFRAGEAHLRQTEVEYPETDARYLRLRLFGGEGQLPLPARARLLRATAATMREISLELTSRSPPGEWAHVDFDLGLERAPCDAIRLAIAEANFSREAEVRVSDLPGQFESPPVAKGTLTRLPVGTQLPHPAVRTELETPGARGRYLRVSYSARAGALHVQGAAARHLAAALVFRAEPSREYRLAYGNPSAEPPSYPEAPSLAAAPSAATGFFLGAETENPAYSPAPLRTTVAAGDVGAPVVLIVAVVLVASAALLMAAALAAARRRKRR